MVSQVETIDTIADDLQFSYIDYSFSVPMFSNEHGEPDDALLTINGEIYCFEEGANRLQVGSVRWYRLDERLAREKGEYLFDVLDAHEGAAQYADLVDIEGDCLNDEIRRQLKMPYGKGSVLIGDRIYIEKKYRGHGMAARIIDDAARRFFDMEFIAIKPFPLQLAHSHDNQECRWGNAAGLNGFPSDPDIASTRLTNYYISLGFELIPNSDLMCMPNKYYMASSRSQKHGGKGEDETALVTH